MKTIRVGCVVAVLSLMAAAVGEVTLPLASTAQAETIQITLHPNVGNANPNVVTFSDGSGKYFDDWRVWYNDSGTPAVYDEKKDATHIGAVAVNHFSRDSTVYHDFVYTGDDAQSGVGEAGLRSCFMLAGGFGTPVSVSLSVSDIGTSGTVYLYTGGWASAATLSAGIDGVSDSEVRPYSGESYTDVWEIEYSGVTAANATLDITLSTTSEHNDMKLSGVSFASNAVPAPSTLVGLVSMGFVGAFRLFGRRRKRAA